MTFAPVQATKLKRNSTAIDLCTPDSNSHVLPTASAKKLKTAYAVACWPEAAEALQKRVKSEIGASAEILDAAIKCWPEHLAEDLRKRVKSKPGASVEKPKTDLAITCLPKHVVAKVMQHPVKSEAGASAGRRKIDPAVPCRHEHVEASQAVLGVKNGHPASDAVHSAGVLQQDPAVIINDTSLPCGLSQTHKVATFQQQQPAVRICTKCLSLERHELPFFRHSRLARQSELLLEDVKRIHHVQPLVCSWMGGLAQAASGFTINGVKLKVGCVNPHQQRVASVQVNQVTMKQKCLW